MAPQPVREAGASNGHQQYQYQETRSSSTMSSLMCCTSTRSQKVMGYKESQKKFLWLDPNRWSGQKTVKKEKVSSWSYLSALVTSCPADQFIRTRSASKICFTTSAPIFLTPSTHPSARVG